MASNSPAPRPRRGTALTAALAIAAVGGPFAATAVIIAEQNHANSTGTSVVGSHVPRNGHPAVHAGSGSPLTVSSGSMVQSNVGGGGVSGGSGPAYAVSSGS